MPISTDDFYLLNDANGMIMVPRKKLQAVLDREFGRTTDAAPSRVHRNVTTRDAAPPQNNLHRDGSSSGSWDRLPGRSRDQSPGTSQGTTGTSTGGSPRRPDRPPTPPSLRGGNFTTDEVDGPRRPPNPQFAPSRTENDGRDPSDENGSGRMGTAMGHSLPMRTPDQEAPDDVMIGKVLGTLEPAPDGYCYRVAEIGDGTLVLVLAPDEGEDYGEGSLNTNDRMRKHRVSDGVDPILRRMNRIHRRLASCDAAFKAEIHRTIFHYPPPKSGARVTLETREDGGVDVILWTTVADAQYGDTSPPGASGGRQENNPGTGPKEEVWVAQPSENFHGEGEHSIHELQARTTYRTGDARGHTAVQLAAMNRDARAFWAERR
jgi:hypothetical protein